MWLMIGILEKLDGDAVKRAGSAAPWLLVAVAKLSWSAYID